jgi:hypothetical protein
VDADVRLDSDAAALLAGHAQATDSGLVSAVPRQIMITLGELLTVPTINLLLLGYLPMGFMRLSRDPGLGAACGQLMLVEREAYRASGGHAAIRSRIHDGIQLARLFRRKSIMTDLVLGDRLATCRMYAGFDEAWAGFAKNAHEGMATPVALPIWTVLLFGGHVLPFMLLPFVPILPLACAALLSLVTRTLVTVAMRIPGPFPCILSRLSSASRSSGACSCGSAMRAAPGGKAGFILWGKSHERGCRAVFKAAAGRELSGGFPRARSRASRRGCGLL